MLDDERPGRGAVLGGLTDRRRGEEEEEEQEIARRHDWTHCGEYLFDGQSL